MNTTEHPDFPPRLWTWLAVAWAVVIAKCLIVPWAIAHWQIPIAPSWIIAPTLVLATVATILLLARFRFGEPQG